jgi:hypothetical protein
MRWAEIFNLPCGCKRHPAKSRKDAVLIQRWDDLCAEHQARKTPEGQVSEVQQKMQDEQKIQETIREMALERIEAKL